MPSSRRPMDSGSGTSEVAGPRPSHRATETFAVGDATRRRTGATAGRAPSLPSVRGHQGTTPSSSKQPPRGPSSGRVASRTAIAAPCSGVRGALKPVKSVAT
ncbi:hypothetical protein QFZ32_008231 [Streptomyces canus]|nr:hypothetical protein [Streptomyces canus]